jgi:hypothetical protein
MALLKDTKSKSRWSAGVMAGVIVTATLALGTFAGTAGAEERWEHRERGRGHYYNGGYYRAPPVVYGSPYQPYYAPPPVVYGPGFGLNFNFR